jgi:hypothetical protein
MNFKLWDMKLIPELSYEESDELTYIHEYLGSTVFITTTNGVITSITFEEMSKCRYIEIYFDEYECECISMLCNDKPFYGNINAINRIYDELTNILNFG